MRKLPKISMNPYNKIIERFQIPEAGEEIIDLILDEKERMLIYQWDKGMCFSEEELSEFLVSVRIEQQLNTAKSFIERAFRRGVLNLTEEGHYCLGTFYGRLDIFATSDAKIYHTLTKQKRDQLDEWYFSSYITGLEEGEAPTADEVLPLLDTLTFIEEKQEQAYLALCDCRMLRGDCNQPVRTCITYRTAPNSFVKRGHAAPISKETAKQIVIDSDKLGLVHTVNPGGVCNCCLDCCYLFRAAHRRNSHGVWPKVHYKAAVKIDNCTGCGKCERRCPFKVLEVKIDETVGKRRVIMTGLNTCMGCGLCVTGCSFGALYLKKTGDKS